MVLCIYAQSAVSQICLIPLFVNINHMKRFKERNLNEWLFFSFQYRYKFRLLDVSLIRFMNSNIQSVDSEKLWQQSKVHMYE